MALVVARVGESPWQWEPRPDVWLLIASIAIAYLWSITTLRKRLIQPPPSVARSTQTKFGCGLVVLWAAVDWPMDRLGDDYLFSAHMVQFLMVSMVAAPLLVVGTPAWLQNEITAPLRPVLRIVKRAPVSLGIFQAVLVGTHLPPVVAAYTANSVVHFGLHTLWIVAALLFWLPILGREPMIKPLQPAAKVVYLIAATVVPTVPASFLTWATNPLYDSYADAPRIWGLSAIDDLQLAGLIMKLGGGFILWGFIAGVFVAWGLEESKSQTSQRRAVPPKAEPPTTIASSLEGEST